MEKLTQTNYVDIAEKVICEKIKKDKWGKISLTTSKIRNLLSLVNSIYNDVVHSYAKNLDENIQSKIQYLRLRFVYESGRDGIVKDFVEQAGIIGYLKQIGDNKKALLLFCKYMEALVAYHKFYGGRD